MEMERNREGGMEQDNEGGRERERERDHMIMKVISADNSNIHIIIILIPFDLTHRSISLTPPI